MKDTPNYVHGFDHAGVMKQDDEGIRQDEKSIKDFYGRADSVTLPDLMETISKDMAIKQG